MARMTIQRIFADGDMLTVSVKVEDSFPDVVAEAKRAIVDIFTDALAQTVVDSSDQGAGE